jgi:hypothetical protein
MIKVVAESIKAMISIPVISILYFRIAVSINSMDKPNAFITTNNKNRTINPLEAPFMSAILKDICEAMHIDNNKNK